MSPAVAAANSSATATAARQHDNQRSLDERRKERGSKRQGGGEEQQTCSVAHSLSRSIAPFMRPASARHTNSSLGDTPISIQTWFRHLNVTLLLMANILMSIQTWLFLLLSLKADISSSEVADAGA